MAKYLARSCPKCNGYLGIVVPERKAKLPVKAINGRCLTCGYRLAWVVILGRSLARPDFREHPSLQQPWLAASSGDIDAHETWEAALSVLKLPLNSPQISCRED